MALIEILKPLVDFITLFISNLGYPGIFSLMVLESALIPIPSEIIMPFSGFLASTGALDPLSIILAGSFGNLVGSVATYYFGLKIGRAFIIKYGRYIFFKRQQLELTEHLFQRYGEKISFIGRLLPGIRTYVSLPAGIGKTKFIKFAVYTFAGSIIWSLILTYMGMQLGSNWKSIEKYSLFLDIAAVIAIVSVILWFIYNLRKSKKRDTKKEQQTE